MLNPWVLVSVWFWSCLFFSLLHCSDLIRALLSYLVYFAWIYTRSTRFFLERLSGSHRSNLMLFFFLSWRSSFPLMAVVVLHLHIASLYLRSLDTLSCFFEWVFEHAGSMLGERKKGTWWKGEKEMVAVNLERCPYIWLWLIWSVFFLFFSLPCLLMHIESLSKWW